MRCRLCFRPRTGEGIDDLGGVIEDYLSRGEIRLDLRVDAADGELLAWIHRNGRVRKRGNDEKAIRFEASFSPEVLGRLRHIFSGRFIEIPEVF